jgi:tRNA U34 2-thiouridine synthase MnmA/TrmU
MDVAGATMKLLDYPAGEDCAGRRSCCSRQDIEDARAACVRLNIDHMVFNFTRAFWREVVEPFRNDYLAGRTPNPCILCNRRMKFDALRERAGILGYPLIATGHYARIAADGGRRLLLKALDPAKDQSYVLYAMTQEELAGTLFPLGDITKADARALCAEADLNVAMKPESQDICFVPDGDYAGFLAAGHGGPEALWNMGLAGAGTGVGGGRGIGDGDGIDGGFGTGDGNEDGGEDGRGVRGACLAGEMFESDSRYSRDDENKAGYPGRRRDTGRGRDAGRGEDEGWRGDGARGGCGHGGGDAGGKEGGARRGEAGHGDGAARRTPGGGSFGGYEDGRGEPPSGLVAPAGIPANALPGPGDILSKDGKIIGRHGGVWRYTVGQRKGLGLPGPDPSYVLRIDPVRNTLTVGRYADLASPTAVVGALNLISVPVLNGPIEIGCKIRYRQPEKPALLEPLGDGRALVTFRTPQTAAAPGQAAVFYDGEIVVGGGTILGPGPP